MTAGLTLDAGAVIGAERASRAVMVLIQRAVARKQAITIPTVVLAQVHRGNQPLIARLLQNCRIEALDETLAKKAGKLLGASRSSDVVDAVVVASAARRGDAIVTSDPDDIERLMAAVGPKLVVVAI
jgi:predicted nucleic acid-binding protein